MSHSYAAPDPNHVIVVQAPTPRGVGRVFKTLGALIATMVALSTLWWGLGQPIQGSACSNVSSRSHIPDWICAPKYRSITREEATSALDIFLFRAGGASPQTSLSMLRGLDSNDREAFVRSWGPILLAERDGDLTAANGFNTFNVTYTTYDGGGDPIGPKHGKVNTYMERARFINGADGPTLSLLGVPTRIGGEVRTYVRSHVTRWTKTYNVPRREPTETAAPKLGVGTTLSLLCQLSNDGTWWSRTGWGWVANADLRSGPGQVPAVPPCGVPVK